MRGTDRGRNGHAAPAPVRRVAAGSWSAELLPRNPYDASYTPDAPVIGFAFEAQNGIHAFGSDRKVGFHAGANGLAFVPRGCDVYSQSDVGGEYLKISFAPGRDEQQPWTRRFSDAVDPVAIDAAHRLRRQLLACNAADDLQCERLVQILRERTAAFLHPSPARPAKSSWMTPRRLRLVDDLIETRLDTGITVEELAEALGLSVGFFSRAFRAAVGKPPHDHIIDRRVSRARALLRSASRDLSAVALASGFASHAHMTSTFRHRLGVTPSEIRKDFE